MSLQRTNTRCALTYLLGGALLIQLAMQKALDYAFQAFDELCKVKRDRVWFSYEVIKSDKTRRNIRIGFDAWASVAPHFARHQVIDIHIQPELIVQDVDSTLPPSDLLRTEGDHETPLSQVLPPKLIPSPMSRPSPENVVRKLGPPPVRKSVNSITPVKTSGRSASSPVKYPRRLHSSGYKLV